MTLSEAHKFATQLFNSQDPNDPKYQLYIVYYDADYQNYAVCNEDAADRMVDNGIIDPSDIYCLVTY